MLKVSTTKGKFIYINLDVVDITKARGGSKVSSTFLKYSRVNNFILATNFNIINQCIKYLSKLHPFTNFPYNLSLFHSFHMFTVYPFTLLQLATYDLLLIARPQDLQREQKGLKMAAKYCSPSHSQELVKSHPSGGNFSSSYQKRS